MIKIALIAIAILVAIESIFVFQEAVDNKSVWRSILSVLGVMMYCGIMINTI